MSSEQTVGRYRVHTTNTMTDVSSASVDVVLARDYDALSTELAEAKAEIERMREALPLLRDSRSSFTSLASADGEDMGEWGAQLARQSYEAIDSYLAALIPAKGKEKP